MATIAIEVPQDVLDSARVTVTEAKVELALALYAQGRLGIGKARELAGMSLWGFLMTSYKLLSLFLKATVTPILEIM